ncbi:HAD family hydrolase [Stakelama sediminis]|uniref:Phosphoglycolate phosphatase n=1 Tax=Stakelama sediminis TaxID=463200 RepID=A0A840Z142_9SPHN|nr:HAD-IA family hydrolase [Stakelama sediminis]MBB5719450.1 phosphoglycolate phosphatase [Stakelama sediminis]
MTTKLALFDCDGTLVDSQANICIAMEAAFGDAGLPCPDRAVIRRIVGLSLVEAVAQLLPDADTALHTAIAGEYKNQFVKLRSTGGMLAEPLYDGIADTLTALEDQGWLLGVATGKSDRGLNIILDHHGLKSRFVTLQTADRHPSKPHPSMIETAMADAGASPETTVMIGDTSFDMIMAVAAGVHPLGVAWGYHAPDELAEAGARHVAGHAREIAPHLEAL